jgi:outer membrane protein assembly factor BamB
MKDVRRAWIGAVALTAMAAALAPQAATAAVVKSTTAPTWQTNGRVRSIAIGDGKIFIGGDFTRVRAPGSTGPGQARNHLAALSATTGALLPWNPNANGQVRALHLGPGGATIYAGGSFTTIGGRSRLHLAAIATDGGAIRLWHANTDGAVDALTTSSSRLYIGGAFLHVKGSTRNRLAAIGLGSTAPLAAWTPHPNAEVRALALSLGGGRIFAGGDFTVLNAHAVAHFAALLVTTGGVRPYGAHPTYPVTTIDATAGTTYIGGAGNGGHIAAFTAVSGTRRWSVEVDGDVQGVAVRAGAVYAGGHFNNECKGNLGTGNPLVCTTPIARRHLLAVSATTGALTTWNPDLNSISGVFAVRATPQQVVAGGVFTKVHGTPQQGVARFTP